MTEPKPKTVPDYIAEVLVGNGGMTEESALNNTVQERMQADSMGRVGDAELARRIYRELGYMVDYKYVEKESRDMYGQIKYRLNDHGRVRYFGTNNEKMREYWGENGLAIALALGNLVITLLATILTIIFN